MGMTPLVPMLPMRLTTTIDPSKHAYKNSRVNVLGWCLSPGEAARLDTIDDPEAALVERPTHIKIRTNKPKVTVREVEADGDLEVILQPRFVVWSRDKDGKAKVRRIGFALVPGFGGTAHGFCGTSINACLSDLLE
jgi:hypothetical protein